MTKITHEEFTRHIIQSRLINSDNLTHWLKQVDLHTPQQTADALVQDKLLTPWQARKLLEGQTCFHLSHYQLLEKIPRHEIGDRFIAIHQPLNRKVSIQILPTELTRHRNRFESFLHKVNQAARLDHSHLACTYDVNQEEGRYFLVTELTEGLTFDQLCRRGLTAHTLVKLIQQILLGLQYAHQNGVSHGNIRPSDIIVTADEQVKLDNFVIASLRPQMAAGYLPNRDLHAISRLGLDSLNNLTHCPTPARLTALQQIFQQLAVEDVKLKPVLSSLNNWVATEPTSDPEPVKHLPNSQASTPPQPLDDSFNRSFKSVVSPIPPYKKSTSRTWKNKSAKRKLFRFSNSLPPYSLALATSLLLAVLIGGTYRAYSTSTRSADQQPAVSQSSPSDDSTTPTAHHPNSANASSVTAINDFLKNTDIQDRKPDTTHPSLSPPESFPTSIDPKQTSRVNLLDESTFTSNPNWGLTSETELELDTEFEPKLESPAPSITTPSDLLASVAASMEQLDSLISADQDNSPTISRPQEAPLIDSSEPFKNFPLQIDLPVETDTTEQKVGDLAMDPRMLLGAELYADRAICKTKLIFEIKRLPDEKQTWQVTVRRRQKEAPTPIAQFRKSEQEVFFRWLDEASNNKHAPYLRNCLIRLKTSEASQWLTLRKPVQLAPLTLTSEKLAAMVETQMVALPQVDCITAEILPIKLPDISPTPSPSTIDLEKRQPGRILLERK